MIAGPSHHADLRQHAQAGRAHHGPADRSARRRAGHLPSQQPLERAPARRRASTESRHPAGAGRDGFAGAGHRHRRRGSGDPGRRHALDRHASCSASAARATPCGKMPKGRLFPLTIDELVEAAALLRAVKRGDLDRTPQPAAPLDILAQQIVAACVAAGEAGLARRRAVRDLPPRLAVSRSQARRFRRGDSAAPRWPPRAAAPRWRRRADHGPQARPHHRHHRRRRDPRRRRLPGAPGAGRHVRRHAQRRLRRRGQRRRHLPARQHVLAHPESERGVVRVADAQGQPPSIPFWLGEGASRTAELSAEIADLREDCADPPALQNEIGLSPRRRCRSPNTSPTAAGSWAPCPRKSVSSSSGSSTRAAACRWCCMRRSADASTAPGGWPCASGSAAGLALSCRPPPTKRRSSSRWASQHSFPLEDVFDYLHPSTVRKVLTQAVLDQPMFESRWRWNATRSLVLERFQNGKPVPPQILRMRAGDLLAASFPAAVACPENLPPGDLPIPHGASAGAPDDRRLPERSHRHRRPDRSARGPARRVDRARRGRYARAVGVCARHSQFRALHVPRRCPAGRTPHPGGYQPAQPRSAAARTTSARSIRPPSSACARKRGRSPKSSEEVHDALIWMGFVTDAEAADWMAWLHGLARQSRVVHADGRWCAVDGPTDPKKILLGRLEGAGPRLRG